MISTVGDMRDRRQISYTSKMCNRVGEIKHFRKGTPEWDQNIHKTSEASGSIALGRLWELVGVEAGVTQRN